VVQTPIRQHRPLQETVASPGDRGDDEKRLEQELCSSPQNFFPALISQAVTTRRGEASWLTEAAMAFAVLLTLVSQEQRMTAAVPQARSVKRSG